MSGGAVTMLLVGAVGLWGGALAAVVHYVRSARRDPHDPFADD